MAIGKCVYAPSLGIMKSFFGFLSRLLLKELYGWRFCW